MVNITTLTQDQTHSSFQISQSTLIHELHQLRQQNANLRQEKQKYKKQVEMQQTSLDELKQQNLKLESQRKQEREYSSKLESEVDRLKAKVQKLQINNGKGAKNINELQQYFVNQ
eukprot:403345458